jgi:hypothetical protein
MHRYCPKFAGPDTPYHKHGSPADAFFIPATVFIPEQILPLDIPRHADLVPVLR